MTAALAALALVRADRRLPRSLSRSVVGDAAEACGLDPADVDVVAAAIVDDRMALADRRAGPRSVSRPRLRSATPRSA